MNYLQKKKQALLNYVSSGGRLPSEYQEVEYIECTTNGNNSKTTTSYFNTQVLPAQSTIINMKFEYDNITNQYTSMGANYGCQLQFTPPDKYGLGNNRITFGSGAIDIEWGVDNNNQRFITIGSSTVSASAPSRQYPILIYGMSVDANGNLYRASGSANNFAMPNGKLYSMQITVNGTLTKDYVPCYRKADNEVGLYDLVNSEFLMNSGNTAFTKGGDI